MNDIEKATEHYKKRNFWLKANPVCQRIQKRVDKQNYEIERNELAILALEKQIPKKPRNNYDCEFFCGNCDTLICDNEPGVEDDYKYCPNCGQAILWEG